MHDVKFYGSATVGTKGQIVIPYEAREDFSLKEGDKVIVIRAPHGAGIMVMKAEQVEELISTMNSHLSSVADSVKNEGNQ